MQKYSVNITNQAHTSLGNIIAHKIESSQDITSAKRFAEGFYQQSSTLSSFPHRGFNISENNKPSEFRQ
ncbi:hypothetical protein SPONL_1577 [uncultured Candidatus Thioglobus sp.]|nr:hypothetical protein SPONL_1577 [uncultured Candidatus Thioglobus sp.]